MFTKNKLRDSYDKYLKKVSSGMGKDRMTKKAFERFLADDKKIEKLCKKLNDKEYEFTSYKEKLVLKGKVPRVISIPTFRDKLILKILSNLLLKKCYEGKEFELAQMKISKIFEEIKDYDSFIKIDITGFYDNIDHNILLNQISSKKFRDKNRIIDLIRKGIRNPTVNENLRKSHNLKKNILGVPQGLSISNILAEIYMESFDSIYDEIENIMYVRFVDDILILYNKIDYNSSYILLEKMELDLYNKLHLKINDNKTQVGKLTEGLSYLGYELKSDRISVKEENIRKFERRLEKKFIEYKSLKKKTGKESKLFYWKLNNMITGVIIGEKELKRYGWLFYFSKIDDETLVYHLDNLRKKFRKRFDIPKEEKLKSFVRTLNEIKKNKNSKYIPKLDVEYKSVKAKREFLIKIAEYSEEEVKTWDKKKLTYKFNGVIFSSLKELEKDRSQEGY